MAPKRKFLSVDDQVKIYNGLSIADRYTYKLKDGSSVKTTVKEAMDVVIKNGFPHSDGPNEVNLEPSIKKLCHDFIEKHTISCPEAVMNDKVFEEVSELVYNLCELIGYYDYDLEKVVKKNGNHE